jgi:hypothetical protein
MICFYIVQKFPLLSHLELYEELLKFISNKHLSLASLSLQVISLFLVYLSNMHSFTVRLSIDRFTTLLHESINALTKQFGVKCDLDIYYEWVDPLPSCFPNFSHVVFLKPKEKCNKGILVKIALKVDYSNKEKLPYIDLLEKAGQQVQNLTNNWDEIPLKHVLYWDDITNSQIIKGSIIAHTLAYCPRLEKWILGNSLLLDCGYIEHHFEHKSLQQLTLIKCRIYSKVFERLSIRLPSLSYLHLYRCCFLNKTNTHIFAKMEGHYTLNMPETKFENLVWALYCCAGVYIRLVDHTGTVRHYKTVGDDLEEPSNKLSLCQVEDYQASILSSKVISLNIHCYSFRTLELRLGDSLPFRVHFPE